MRKLFLSSAGIVPETKEEFLKILGNDPRNLTAAFIPTAADPAEDKTFVQWSIDQIEGLGMKLFTVDLKEENADTLYDKLSKADIIWVNGGDTIYLIDQIRKSGFDQIIDRLIDEGRIYVGVSAGSYISCPTIPATDLAGLGLADFHMVVHYEDKYRQEVEDYAKTANYPVFALTDQQAIIIHGEDFKIVGSGEINRF